MTTRSGLHTVGAALCLLCACTSLNDYPPGYTDTTRTDANDGRPDGPDKDSDAPDAGEVPPAPPPDAPDAPPEVPASDPMPPARCGVSDGQCPAGCTADPDCERPNGASCSQDQECRMRNCISGRCCRNRCETCSRCSDDGSMCQFVPRGMTDDRPVACSGTKACDGAGACKAGAGQACTMASDCGSGTCMSNKCCHLNSCAGTEILASAQAEPTGLAVDARGVYWTNQDDGTVWVLETGSTVPRPLAMNSNTPAAIALSANHVYWWARNVSPVGHGVLRIARTATGGVGEVVSAAEPHTFYSDRQGVALTVNEQYVHWVLALADRRVSSRATLYVAPVNGGPAMQIDDRAGHGYQDALETNGQSVFWIAQGLMTAPIAGGTARSLFDNGRESAFLDVVGPFVYLLSNGTNSDWVARKIPVEGGAPQNTSLGRSDPKGWLAVDATHYYWLAGHPEQIRVYLITKAPISNAAMTTILATTEAEPNSVKLSGGFVYWTEPSTGKVKRAPTQ